MPQIILIVLGLALLCIGVGALLLSRFTHRSGALAWCGLRGLIGFLILAAGLNLCSLMQVNRPLAIAGCAVVASIGFSAAWMRRTGGPKFGAHDLLLSVGLLILLAAPVTMLWASPAKAHDAIAIWLPKAEAWIGGPEFAARYELREWHESYPRGGPAVAALLAHDVSQAAKLQRSLAILVFIFSAAAITGIGELCGHPFTGVLAGLSPMVIPEFAAYLATGYMDILVSCSLIGVAVGFAIARVHPVGFLYAALAGAGAIACKQEGAAVGLAVALMAFWSAIKTRSWLPISLGLPAAIFVVPWLLMSGGGDTWAMNSLTILLEHPARLLERGVTLAERYGRLLIEALPPDAGESHPAFGPYISLWAIAFYFFAWFLRPGKRFGLLPVFPALLLSAAHGFVLAIAHQSLSWQIAYSANRLFIQAAPLFLAAACFRLSCGPVSLRGEGALASGDPQPALTSS